MRKEGGMGKMLGMGKGNSAWKGKGREKNK